LCYGSSFKSPEYTFIWYNFAGSHANSEKRWLNVELFSSLSSNEQSPERAIDRSASQTPIREKSMLSTSSACHDQMEVGSCSELRRQTECQKTPSASRQSSERTTDRDRSASQTPNREKSVLSTSSACHDQMEVGSCSALHSQTECQKTPSASRQSSERTVDHDRSASQTPNSEKSQSYSVGHLNQSSQRSQSISGLSSLAANKTSYHENIRSSHEWQLLAKNSRGVPVSQTPDRSESYAPVDSGSDSDTSNYSESLDLSHCDRPVVRPTSSNSTSSSVRRFESLSQPARQNLSGRACSLSSVPGRSVVSSGHSSTSTETGVVLSLFISIEPA
jgi:hypothetical protein